MGFLTGKRALIVGLASERSIAHGVGEAMKREGAELAFTYQNDKLKSRVEAMATEWGSNIVLPCDLAVDADIDNVFVELKKVWPEGVDIIVHSAAFAPGGQLEGDYLDCVTREGSSIAHDISSYSFAALAKSARAAGMLRAGGSLVTMSYYGAEKALPNYNIMGVAKASLEANVRYMAYSLGRQNIRVNGISAGPIRTLAASGVKSLRKMLAYYEQNAPLRRNVTTEEVGNTAAFLCSDLASGITGEVVHVDSGFHVVGMSDVDVV